jgi:hypothetical protein
MAGLLVVFLFSNFLYPVFDEIINYFLFIFFRKFWVKGRNKISSVEIFAFCFPVIADKFCSFCKLFARSFFAIKNGIKCALNCTVLQVVQKSERFRNCFLLHVVSFTQNPGTMAGLLFSLL